MRKIQNQYRWTVALVFLVVTIVVVVWQLGRSGPREIGPIENIDGIPFPKQADGTMVVTEKLAHADVSLTESVLGKSLRLTVTFSLGNLTKLEVGVRENEFWLSYAPTQELYSSWADARAEARGEGGSRVLTRTVEIPLTDKLPDRDGSVDVMFFATNSASQATEDEGTADATLWYLQSITAEVSPVLPTWAQFKDFVRSGLTRERPR